jgi:hypothetical protein
MIINFVQITGSLSLRRSRTSFMKSSLGGLALYSIAIFKASLNIYTTLVPLAADTKLKGTPSSSTNLYYL